MHHPFSLYFLQPQGKQRRLLYSTTFLKLKDVCFHTDKVRFHFSWDFGPFFFFFFANQPMAALVGIKRDQSLCFSTFSLFYLSWVCYLFVWTFAYSCSTVVQNIHMAFTWSPCLVFFFFCWTMTMNLSVKCFNSLFICSLIVLHWVWFALELTRLSHHIGQKFLLLEVLNFR